MALLLLVQRCRDTTLSGLSARCPPSTTLGRSGANSGTSLLVRLWLWAMSSLQWRDVWIVPEL